MTADRRDLLIPAIRSVRVADGCIHLDREEAWAVANALLPVIDRLCAEEAADALRDAADAALPLGRRGPNAIADWLLDRGAAYRARAIHPTREDQQ